MNFNHNQNLRSPVVNQKENKSIESITHSHATSIPELTYGGFHQYSKRAKRNTIKEEVEKVKSCVKFFKGCAKDTSLSEIEKTQIYAEIDEDQRYLRELKSQRPMSCVIL